MNLMEAVNKQFNFEIQSAYEYMGMAAYCDAKGFSGFNHFFVKQAKEEMEHAQKFYEFLLEMDEVPEYGSLEAPKKEYDSFVEVFKTALEHEQEVTRRIKAIYKQAQEEGCLDTQEFLNWFISEQREEEDTFRTIVERAERIGDSWNGLYIYDRELAQR